MLWYFYNHCHVQCHLQFFTFFIFRYNALGHHETMSTDVAHLLDYLPPEFKEFADTRQKLNVAGNASSNASGHDLEEKYLSRLSPEQKKGLCQMFEWDFQLFGYQCWLWPCAKEYMCNGQRIFLVMFLFTPLYVIKLYLPPEFKEFADLRQKLNVARNSSSNSSGHNLKEKYLSRLSPERKKELKDSAKCLSDTLICLAFITCLWHWHREYLYN